MIIVENLRKKNLPEQPGAGAEADAGQKHSGNWSGLGVCPFLLRCGPCTSVCEMKKYMMKHSLFLALIWCAALVLCASCVIRHVRGTNGNLGVWLTDGLAAGLLAYAVWHEPIHRFCSHGVGRVLAILFGCGMALFVCLLAFVAVSGYSDQPRGEKKAVIVLGAGLRGERITSLLKCRLDAAYAYWMDHPETLLVVTGGQGPGETVPEGQAMKQYLVERGVPAEQILAECASTSTEENFAFSRPLLAERGISAGDPVVLATNAFHCYRAGKYAAMAGFTDVDKLPASINASAVLPCYFREVFAVLYYWVFKSSASGWIHGMVGRLQIK